MASQRLVWQMLMCWMYCWTVIRPPLLKSNIVYQTIVSLFVSVCPKKEKKMWFMTTLMIHCHALTDGAEYLKINWVKCVHSFVFVVSQNSLCVTSKLAQITVERENGCLGLTLRGGGEFPLIVTNVRPHGPVFKIGRIKPGDRLLRVDNVSTRDRTQVNSRTI